MAFVVDPSGFGLVPMQDRAVWDEDTTPNGFDGIRRTLLGEYTFEFKNALQRIGIIKNLKASATALASKRENVSSVNVVNTESAPVYTQEVSAT